MASSNPLRATHLLMRQHGRVAKNHAMQRALDMRMAEDEQGEEFGCVCLMR